MGEPTFATGGGGDGENNSILTKLCNILKKHNIEMFEHYGDVNYSKGSKAAIDRILAVFGSTFPVNISKGNHDGDQSEDEQNAIDIAKYLKLKLKEGKSGNREDDYIYYYHYIHKNRYVIVLDSYDPDYTLTSGDQFLWCKERLQEASTMKDEGQIDWLEVMTHVPMYSRKNKRGPDRGSRDRYYPLFKEYKVDLVQHGHAHNEQISKSIEYEEQDGAPQIDLDDEIMSHVFNHTVGTNHGINTIVHGRLGHDEPYPFGDSEPDWIDFSSDNDGDDRPYSCVLKQYYDEGKNLLISIIDENEKVKHRTWIIKDREAFNKYLPKEELKAVLKVPKEATPGTKVIADGTSSTGYDALSIAENSSFSLIFDEKEPGKWEFEIPQKTDTNDLISLTLSAQRTTEDKTIVEHTNVNESIKIVDEIITPPPTGNNDFPIENVEMFYDSDTELDQDGTYKTKQYIKKGGVILPSGASGANPMRVRQSNLCSIWRRKR